ncbi:MAG: pyridoxamine 5'-phosphate oxidase family protein [Actinomycetota bacterium]
MSPRRDVSMTPEEVAAFLQPARTAVFTTLDRAGWPHCTAMWFNPEQDRLSMWTYAKSQKAKNLVRDPRTALLVEDGAAYNELKGVLIRGRAQVIDTFEEVADVGRRLYERYTLPATGVAIEDGPIVEIERQARKRVAIVVPMDDVASWDHAKL